LLPDAPEGSASASGVVLDTTGAAVPGAQVILTRGDGTEVRSMMSGGAGGFRFANLPAGSYLVLIHAKGFATFTSEEFDLSAQQPYEVPNISLSVASADTE